MFELSSVFILTSDDAVYLLPVDEGGREEITECFSNAKEDMVDRTNLVEFDGKYKPEKDECLYINEFTINCEIIAAIENPASIQDFEKVEGSFPNIKALFVGEKSEENGTNIFKIAFQLIKKDQRLSLNKRPFFFKAGVFQPEHSFGISISNTIECYFENERLYFQSFYFARQIFDLSQYYRLATDREVENFLSHMKLMFENKEIFQSQADNWVRRRIATINDSQFLKRYTAEEFVEMANNIGITLDAKDGRIVIPADKEKMKIVLGFLDEETHKGPLSNFLYLANSRRKISE